VVEFVEPRTLFSMTYYVSPGGSNSNAGTSIASPWKTIAKVNSAKVGPGSDVLFQGGATFAGSISGKSGTSSAPITYGSYGTGRAVINAGSGTGFSAIGKTGIVVHNLDFLGVGVTGNHGNGLVLSGRDITIDQVDVGGFNNNGIDFTRGSHFVNVTNSTIHDCGYAGIQVQGIVSNGTGYSNSNVYIGRDTVWNIVGRGNGEQHTGNGILIWDVNSATVERCVVHDNGINNTNASGPAAIWCFQADHVTFQYNESYHNLSSSSDGDGFDFDGGTINSVMQYNYAHDNQGAGILSWEYAGARRMNGNTIRCNICQNDGLNSFYAELTTGGGALTNQHIYNNTLYSTTTAGVRLDGVSGQFANNIIQTTSPLTPLLSAGSATLAGNDLWNGAALGSPNGISVNPQLTNPGGGGTIGNADLLDTLTPYQLASTSPLINAGVNLQSRFGINPGTQDFFGDPLPQNTGLDIGADERV
jgi:Right handed beta helix region